MVIHEILIMLTTNYINEPAQIFTDCLNCIHIISTQLKHQTLQNNRADKTILKEIVNMLTERTQPTTIHKVKAHTNITRNEQADKQAKEGSRKRDYQFTAKPHEYAHTTPYYFQKDIWPCPNKDQTKDQ